MKTFIFLFVLSITTVSYAQLIEDFSDGDFTSNPAWSGDADNFVVNANNQLQLLDDVAGQSFLSTQQIDNNLNNKEWRFFIKESFSPSGSNFGRVYLSSSNANLSFTGDNGAATDGYFLLFGEAGGGDAIRLFRNNTDLTTTELGFGSEGFINSSFEITVKVSRDNLGNWVIYVDEDAGENYVQLFTAFDDSFSSGGFQGIVCNYTISNADNFYFDDFYYGDEIIDTEAPEIFSLEVISSTEIDLLFNEAIDLGTSQNTANYSVSGIGNPVSAIIDLENSSLIHLTFASNFPAGENLTLNIQNVTDLASNIITTTDWNFMFLIPVVAEYRQLIFSEIMADPNPVVNLPEVEYVELKNNSNEIFNLENWTFVNTSTEKTLSSFILEPGELVILCDANDSVLMQPYGDVLSIGSFTALANSGDSLTLLSPEGTIIDVISYSSSWYNNPELDDGGYSLVNNNYESTCAWNDQNWSVTSSSNGGSPGQDNLFVAVPDNNAPQVIGVSLLSESELIVFFDEILDESSILPANFSIDGGLDIDNVILDPSNTSAVIISFDIIINYGQEYTINTENIIDCEGDIMSALGSFSFTLGFSPELDDLIINEIMADPDSDFPSPNVEYVEIYNKSDKLIELRDLSFTGSSIESSYLMEPYSYVVLTDSENSEEFSDEIPVVFIENMVTLTNSGRELEILDAEGNTIDHLIYSLEWYGDNTKDDGGYSLERINPEDPCSDIDNWKASISFTGSTEGKINSINDTLSDHISPEALYALTWNGNSVEVIFDEQISGFSLDNVSISIVSSQNNTIIYPEDTIYYLSTASANSMFVLFEEPFDTNYVWTMTINGVEDCWGNPCENQVVNFAQGGSFESSDIIINEILVDPRENGEDYIELFNNSNHNINLQNWFLANIEDGEISNFKSITDLPRILFAQHYLVLTKSKTSITSNYPFAQKDNILVMETLPTYSNDDGTVILISSLDEVADSLNYDEDMHFALLDITKGVSLERLNPSQNTNDKTNWHSAAEDQNFGTPGYKNSQFINSQNEDQLLSVSPEVFSPNNDGFQDVVTLEYTFEKPGYLNNITIYDHEGRKVKKLLKNHLSGIKNSVSWDGIDDQNRLAPMGIYVILLEYFDLEGNVNYEKSTCVLGHYLN